MALGAWDHGPSSLLHGSQELEASFSLPLASRRVARIRQGTLVQFLGGLEVLRLYSVEG